MVSPAVYIVCNTAMVKFDGGILNFTQAFKLHQPKHNIN